MVRYTGPKNRVARRFGANIFGRARNPLLHKPNPAGMHGARRRKKSDYGMQLDEKQKLKAVYGMLTEKQLLRYFKEAVRRQGVTHEEFIQQLECRLDVVVYRLKFAATIFAAHQLVSHGHVFVNGKKVDRRSFQVKPGMVVSIRDKSQKIGAIQASLANSARDVPAYLELDATKCSGTLMMLPAEEQISLPVTINLAVVCDFLAHIS